jgi:hypothetical protein
LLFRPRRASLRSDMQYTFPFDKLPELAFEHILSLLHVMSLAREPSSPYSVASELKQDIVAMRLSGPFIRVNRHLRSAVQPLKIVMPMLRPIREEWFQRILAAGMLLVVHYEEPDRINRIRYEMRMGRVYLAISFWFEPSGYLFYAYPPSLRIEYTAIGYDNKYTSMKDQHCKTIKFDIPPAYMVPPEKRTEQDNATLLAWTQDNTPRCLYLLRAEFALSHTKLTDTRHCLFII